MTFSRGVIVCLSVVLLLVSCGGRTPEPEYAAPSGASVFAAGEKVRSVSVTYDGLEPDRIQRLESYQAHTILHDSLESRLGGAGVLDPSGALEVVVHLDTFRLRSSGSAFWLGAMAGADHVVADVRVTRNGTEAKTFKTDTSTILGGIVYASASKRTRRMMNTLAERIVSGL